MKSLSICHRVFIEKIKRNCQTINEIFSNNDFLEMLIHEKLAFGPTAIKMLLKVDHPLLTYDTNSHLNCILFYEVTINNVICGCHGH